MTSTMEVARDEGGDDRRRDVAVARLNELFERTYPEELTDRDLQRFFEDADHPEEQQPTTDRADPPVGQTRTVEGHRAIYGYEPDGKAIGNVALAAAIQSNGFMPAGLQGRPRNRRTQVSRRLRSRGSFPLIDDVF